MIINRYIIGQITKRLLAILGTLVALFGGFSIADSLTDEMNSLVPTSLLAAMIGLRLLIALEVLVPISLYLAVVLSFGRLYGDSEFPAMFAMGLPPARVRAAVLALSVWLAVGVAGVSLIVRPWAYREAHVLARAAETMLNVDAMRPGTFYVADGGKRVVFFARRNGSAQARQVFVETRRPDRLTVIAAGSAQRASDAAPDVSLHGAYVYQIGKGAQPDQIVNAGSILLDPDAKPDPPGYSSVAASTAHLVQSGSPADIAELQWRLSTGLSTVLLGMLGVPLSRTAPRQGKHARFGAAVLIYSVYYLLCSSARSLVQTGVIPSPLGLWWAPGLLGLVLLIAMRASTPGRANRFA